MSNRCHEGNYHNPLVPQPHAKSFPQPNPFLHEQVPGVRSVYAFERVLTQLHELTGTPALEVFSRKSQIRKVQSTDWRGGGEESCEISGNHPLSNGSVGTTTLEVRVGCAATAKLPAQVLSSGVGACEIVQQLWLDLETATGGRSAWFIPIRSQAVFVSGAAHSFACE